MSKLTIFKNIFKSILPVASFYLAVNFSFSDDKAVQMSAFIATGFLFIFMFFAKKLGESFSSIGIAGLDIKMRELKNSLNELKELSLIVAALSYDVIYSRVK